MIIILLLSLYFFFKRKNLVYALSGYIFMVKLPFDFNRLQHAILIVSLASSNYAGLHKHR